VVGVVAPAFAVPPRPLARGVTQLRRMGFRVRLGDHVLAQDGYLAGADALRTADLRTMIESPDVRAIWFARGGYGTTRLLDELPWPALRRHPGKALIGYSDLTALFGAAVDRAGLHCLYGPVVTELGRARAYHAESLRALLAGRSVEMRLGSRQVLAGGRARGRLVGGNLTVLAHLQGSAYAPDARGAVLFVEDVGEEAYRVDRALTQLKLAGVFKKLAAVLVGRTVLPPTRRSFPADRQLDELLRDFFLPLGVPVIRDIPAGHVDGKWTLPLGGTVELDTHAARLRFVP
jgi:muramoyltetrapeptide carboxypeptidase